MIWAAIALVAAACLLRRCFITVRVTGTSMEPTLRAAQRVLVWRVGLGRVRRGQVVVLAFPPDPPGAPARMGNPSWLIKRAVALPGDPVPRADVPALRNAVGDRVPADRLVVLGDNRGSSYDSRTAGYFPASALLGVVVRTMRT